MSTDDKPLPEAVREQAKTEDYTEAQRFLEQHDRVFAGWMCDCHYNRRWEWCRGCNAARAVFAQWVAEKRLAAEAAAQQEREHLRQRVADAAGMRASTSWDALVDKVAEGAMALIDARVASHPPPTPEDR